MSDCFIGIKGKLEGGEAVLNLANKYYSQGKNAIAEEILSELNIDTVLDEAKEKVKTVD